MQMNRESPKGLVTELRGRNGVTEMKVKHFLSGATLLSAALLLNAPLSAAVESDTVGYTTVEMEAGKWYLLGNPFVPLSKVDTFSVNEVFQGDGFGANDVLFTLSAEGTFQPHYWRNNKWCTDIFGTTPADTQYPITTAVYINKQVDGNVVFTGKVAAIEVEIGSQEGQTWSLTSLTFPADKKLSDYTWTNFGENDVLYTLAEDGTFKAHYWRNNKWCTDVFGIAEDESPLQVGHALYINKQSAGFGTAKLK